MAIVSAKLKYGSQFIRLDDKGWCAFASDEENASVFDLHGEEN